MKILISKEQFESFYNTFNNPKYVKKYAEEKSNWSTTLIEHFNKMFGLDFMGDKDYRFQEKFNSLKKFKIIMEYTTEKEATWKIQEQYGTTLLISFSGSVYFYDSRFGTLVEEPDYDGLTIGEIHNRIGNMDTQNLPAEVSSLCLNDVKDKKSVMEEKEKELKKLESDISWAKTEELAKMQKEIDDLQEKLRERKNELMAEMNEKLAEVREKMNALNKQIYRLEAEIYMIRSYNGETLELNKVRSGKSAPVEMPIVLNQKLFYLDEDLARILSLYQFDVSKKYQLFEEALAYSDNVAEAICPQEKCISFFRLSKNASYPFYDDEKHMYVMEELVHGKKIGFVVRNGENYFLGWLDEVWGEDINRDSRNGIKERYVTFQDNLMYRRGETHTTDVDDEGKIASDNQNTMLSRAFAMSVLQGCLDNKALVELPEKVNLMKPSQYVIYNFADAWLTDERFGDFDTLVQNLNNYTKVQDTILLFHSVRGGGSYRSNGDRDMTYDCEVEDGINTINLFKNGTIYVSAKKKYSIKGTHANVAISPNEFINISYMNSIWLKYYVQTKKMGSFCRDYAYMIKHFKRAIEIIEEREKDEIIAIKKYYPTADKISDWQILLSHWKLKNKIRKITDFQAKRVATYLESGKYFEMANLFEKEAKVPVGICIKYAFTLLNNENHNRYVANTEYDCQSKYGQQSFTFYINKWEKEDVQKKEFEEKMKEFSTLIPERINKDTDKLKKLATDIDALMKNYSISYEEMRKCMSENKVAAYVDFVKGLPFIPVEALTEKQEKNIRSGILNGLEGTITNTNNDLWPLYYANAVQKFYNDIEIEVAKIVHEKWLYETKEYKIR